MRLHELVRLKTRHWRYNRDVTESQRLVGCDVRRPNPRTLAKGNQHVVSCVYTCQWVDKNISVLSITIVREKEAKIDGTCFTRVIIFTILCSPLSQNSVVKLYFRMKNCGIHYNEHQRCLVSKTDIFTSTISDLISNALKSFKISIELRKKICKRKFIYFQTR